MVESAVHHGGKAWQQSQYIPSQKAETGESLWATYFLLLISGLQPIVLANLGSWYVTKQNRFSHLVSISQSE